MIVQYHFQLTQSISPIALGPQLYMALNKLAGSKGAEYFHRPGRTSLSQYLYQDEGRLYWCVNTLDEKTHGFLGERLSAMTQLSLAKERLSLSLQAPPIVIEPATLIRKHMVESDPPRVVQLSFLSPTAFRVAGRYEILPQVALLLQSLYQAWETHFGKWSFADERLAESWSQEILLSRHRLRSAAFSFKQMNIPGFMGEIGLSLRGSNGLRRLNGLLLACAPYFGVGVKTALGMGGVVISDWTTVNRHVTMKMSH